MWYVLDVKGFADARVNLTVTIHSTGQTLDSFGFTFVEHVSNPSAYDVATQTALPVSFTTGSLGNRITIQFTSPQGDGYKFVLILDLHGGWNFGTSGTDYFVSWGWSADIPAPVKVSVILPAGGTLVHVEGPVSEPTSSSQSGRTVVSFSGTAVPGTYFKWTVVYTPPSPFPSTAEATSSVTSISATRSSSALQTQSTQVGASVAQTQSTQSTGLVMPSGSLGLIGLGAIVAVIAFILVVVRRKKTQAAVTKQQPAPRVQFKKGVAPVQPIVATGYPDLDEALKGGVPEGFAVVIVSASYDERDLLLRRIIQSSLSSGRSVFYISNDLARTQDLITRYPEGLYAFSSQAEKVPSHPANLYRIPGIENLSDANISLNIAIKDARAKEKANKPVMIIDILSDVLLRHKSVTTRRWLSDFVSRHKTDGFTVIASLNPLIGTRDEAESVIDFFDGVFEVYEKPLQERTRRFLVVRKMYGRDYSDNELLLDRRKLI